MKFFDLFRFLDTKSSEARKVIAISSAGQAQPTPRNFLGFSVEGYQKNIIAYKAISIIARNFSSVPWNLLQKRGNKFIKIEEHPILTLLSNPNPTQAQSSFFEAICSYYLISGNSYIEAIKYRNEVSELWPLRPDRMKVVPNSNGDIAKFIYTVNQYSKTWEVDIINLKSDILHVKTFNPINDYYGMSPIEAAMYGIDQHNASSIWNYNLLKNEAKPSGVFSIVDSEGNGANLTTEQFERVKYELNEQYSGSNNSGRPLVLEGGIKWEQMSMSPKDMDWLEAKNTSARDISLAFGLPPILLNIPGDSTYSNYKEARLALYEDTIIPLLTIFKDELNKWLTPVYGDNLYLEFDKNSIDALVEKRDAKYAQIVNADFLTINEKRIAVGLDEVDGLDIFLFNGGKIPVDKDSPEFEMQADVPEDTPNADAESEEEEDEIEIEEDDEKSFKSSFFNLINKNDRIRAWKAQNQMMRKLENAFQMDIQEILLDQSKAIEIAANNSNIRDLERDCINAAMKFNDELAKVFIKHDMRILKTIGYSMLDAGKSSFQLSETKVKKSKYDQAIEQYLKTNTAKKITMIQGTTEGKIISKVRKLTQVNIEEGEPITELSKQLREEFDYLSRSRANAIARTETHNASMYGSLNAAKSLDIPGLMKEWLSVNDYRTRDGESDGEANHVEMNGKKVNLDDKFIVKVNGYSDEEMDAPGDPSASAEQVINCRCVMVFSQGK